MSANKYRMERALDPAAWDQFVQASPQGTIFSEWGYLEATGRSFELFFLYVGQEVRGGLALVCGDDGYELDDMIIYNGLMFCPPLENQKPNGVVSEQFRLSEFAIAELSTNEDQIVMSLSPEVIDARPFLWHNYRSGNEAEKYAVDVRYTSYLGIRELAGDGDVEETEIFTAMDAKRRQSLRRAERQGATAAQTDDVDLLARLYSMTFAKQNQQVPEARLAQLCSVCRWALENDRGRMYMARNADGSETFVALFIFDRRRAYYMFGAGDHRVSDDYSGTLVLWHAFLDLASNGITEVDLEGVNSPQRGWFKLSFGGDLRPYYEVSLGRAKS